MALEFELLALHLLGRYSTTKATESAFLAFVIFQIAFYAFCSGWPWTNILPPPTPE
jgi:hypothetical protein